MLDLVGSRGPEAPLISVVRMVRVIRKNRAWSGALASPGPRAVPAHVPCRLTCRAAHRTGSGAQPKLREDLRAEHVDELGLVAADVVEVDLVEAHVHVVLDVRDVDPRVG